MAVAWLSTVHAYGAEAAAELLMVATEALELNGGGRLTSELEPQRLRIGKQHNATLVLVFDRVSCLGPP